jgi:hypothetical protein
MHPWSIIDLKKWIAATMAAAEKRRSWKEIMKLWKTDNAVTYSLDEKKITAATRSIGLTVVIFGVAGLIFIYFWADGLASHMPKDMPSLGRTAFVSADLLAAAAAAGAGALFGFIFAIPRTLDPASRAVVADAASRDPGAAAHAVLAANTNLERISDWLTTLLIGATLVQIKSIAEWVGALGKNLVTAGAAANDAIVPIIVIYYFTLAFLGVYLITRLYLTSAFQQTLGFLAAAGQPGGDVSQLKQTLDNAAQSAKSEELKASLDSYDSWPLSRNQRNDPDLNARFARVLCKAIKIGAVASRSGDAAEDAKNAFKAAATDATIKAQLKREAAEGTLATGNAALDSDITGILA